MSRSYKRYPEHLFRRPKGKKKAVLEGARKGAIPPSHYDDLFHDKQCRIPEKVAMALLQKGESDDAVAAHIKEKFKVRIGLAQKIVRIARRMIDAKG